MIYKDPQINETQRQLLSHTIILRIRKEKLFRTYFEGYLRGRFTIEELRQIGARDLTEKGRKKSRT